MFSRSSRGSVCTSAQSTYKEAFWACTLRATLCQSRSKRSWTRGPRKTTLTASFMAPTALYSTALFSPSRRMDTCGMPYWSMTCQIYQSSLRDGFLSRKVVTKAYSSGKPCGNTSSVLCTTGKDPIRT